MKTEINPNWTLDETLSAAGLDWEPVKEPLISSESGAPVDGYVRLSRGFGGKQLGVVGESHGVWGVRNMVQDLMDMGKELGYPLRSLRVLRGGKDIIGYFKVRHWDIEGDVSYDEMAVQDNLNGERQASAFAYYERLICTNGMTQQIKGNALSARHTSRFRLSKDRMLSQLQSVFQASEGWEDFNRRMAGWNVTTDQTVALVGDAHDILRPRPEDADKVDRWERARLAFMAGVGEVYKSHTIQSSPAALGTAFGAFNAVTEYLDRPRARVKDREARIALPSSSGNKDKADIMAMFETNLSLSSF